MFFLNHILYRGQEANALVTPVDKDWGFCCPFSDFVAVVHNVEFIVSLTDFQLIVFIFFSSHLVTYQLY